MSARLLIEVALRILGIWLLLDAIVSGGATTTMFASSSLNSDYSTATKIGIAYLIQFALGGMLIVWAPGIAAKFYPREGDQPESQVRVRPGDVYYTASFVLGVYLLVGGVQSAALLAATAISFGWTDLGELPQYVVSATVNTIAGIILIFGARRIGKLVSALGHDPESIPQQQFSLKLLLIITCLVAVVLGLIRLISVGNP